MKRALLIMLVLLLATLVNIAVVAQRPTTFIGDPLREPCVDEGSEVGAGWGSTSIDLSGDVTITNTGVVTIEGVRVE